MYHRNNIQGIKQGEPLSTKETLQYSLIGLVVFGGAVLLGRSVIKKAIIKNEQSKTLEEGTAPTYAKQIKMAFQNDGWWGTDTEALRNALRSIPSKAEFRKVITSYQRLYGSSLLGDMQAELKSSEYNEMLYIISAKPEAAGGQISIGIDQLQSWAKRLKAAFDMTYGFMPGTDEEAIRAVFLEIPTQSVFTQVGTVYQALYGNTLIDDLKGELEFWEYDAMLQIINNKPKS